MKTLHSPDRADKDHGRFSPDGLPFDSASAWLQVDMPGPGGMMLAGTNGDLHKGSLQLFQADVI